MLTFLFCFSRPFVLQSCVTGTYSEHAESLVVQTAWGLMGLLYARYSERKPIERAIKLIISRQLPVSFSWSSSIHCLLQLTYSRIPSPVKLFMHKRKQDGSWPVEAMEGIFNKSCTITYPNFKFSFVIWALGKAHKYLKELD